MHFGEQERIVFGALVSYNEFWNSSLMLCNIIFCVQGGGDFQISWKKKSLEHIQPEYAYFGTEVVFLTKYNESVLEGKIPGNHL